MTKEIGLVIDLFAGGGGASTGLEAALGRPVDYAINHDPIALAVHAANHPDTVHLTSDIWKVKPLDVTKGRRVRILWGSPDCRHHSNAKGGKPLNKKVRFLAWSIYRWAHDVRPEIIFLENVPEFRDWGPLDENQRPIADRKGESFRRWVGQIRSLGYEVDWRILNAAHYGAPTARKRLFFVARRDGHPIRWPAPTHGEMGLPAMRSAAECIDWDLPCPSIFARKKPLVPATLHRIAQGIKRFVLGRTPFTVSWPEARTENRAQAAAFLVKHFGGVVGVPFDGRPLDTITTWDHHALTLARLAPLGEYPTEALRTKAFLTTYYGATHDLGQDLRVPTRTITTKDRMALVTVAGTPLEIVDIGMRMLTPGELLRAQFGRFSSDYDLSAAPTKTDQVRLIGNSVVPCVAEAVVRVNA